MIIYINLYYRQRCKTNINNNLLIALYIVLAIVFLIFIAVLVYYNNLTGGKIKLIGM